MAQTVFIVGATGNTGGSIINALLNEPDNFKLIAAVRPASVAKPAVSQLKQRGVNVIPLDLNSSKDELVAALRGVDVVISAVVFTEIPNQIPLIDAAKEVGVKRFIPCDFGTPCVKGVRELHDEKLKIREYIQNRGIGYTFIDVGWWMQTNLPHVVKSDKVYAFQADSARHLYEGNHATLFTDLRDIGPFVARIIADPRTLNHYVVIWGEEATQKQVFEIFSKVWGEEIATVHKTAADVLALIETSRNATDPSFYFWEYLYSMWIRGDNKLENAKKSEYGSALDARELYPTVPVRSLADFAKESLSNPTM